MRLAAHLLYRCQAVKLHDPEFILLVRDTVVVVSGPMYFGDYYMLIMIMTLTERIRCVRKFLLIEDGEIQ